MSGDAACGDSMEDDHPNGGILSATDPRSDASLAAVHAAKAEDFLEGISGGPDELLLRFVMAAAAHASLATYYELRAQR